MQAMSRIALGPFHLAISICLAVICLVLVNPASAQRYPDLPAAAGGQGLADRSLATARPLNPTRNVGYQQSQFDDQVYPVEPALDEVAYPVLADPFTVRIKDITSIEGHRSNRVHGIGLVAGLKGTGGRGTVTEQVARTLFQNYGILIDQTPTKSLSVVWVTAEVPPFYQEGEKLTATVAAMDDPASLYGGVLMGTPLKAVDGKVYALAEGSLVIGGFSAQGSAGSVRKNHDTVGRVDAQMVAPICEGPAFHGGSIRLLLKNKDYTTAQRIAVEINKYFRKSAHANHSGSVDVKIPNSFRGSEVDFVVMINNLRVEPDNPARVVINEKTGTIVIGKDVKISRAVFAKDNLIITTSETPVASQPAPQSRGQTVVLPRTQIQATEQGGRYNTLNNNITVGDLANALNMLGVTPQDLISVLQSIKREGSLQAELVVE